jgi:decaprenylphospho-beta-D-erythro-pentofuranosid-2-ulose 2-reductase
MNNILILGSNSDIAKAIAKQYAQKGFNLLLASRKPEIQKEFAKDLMLRNNVEIECHEFNVLDYSTHDDFLARLEGQFSGVICAVGYLGKQENAQICFDETSTIIGSNYTGVVSILNKISEVFLKKDKGFIVAISSVAGERGRKSNYIYGSAKAALTAYLSGLRNSLYNHNIHVLTVNPGFVSTKMTKHLDLPEKLTSSPEQVAKDIYNAQQSQKNVLYTSWVWQWIMLIIKLIPESIFKRLSL